MSIRIAHRPIARSIYRDIYRRIIDSPFDQGDPPVPVGAPEALNVQIDGGVMVGEELTGAYDYYSPDGVPEDGTTFQWFASAQPSGELAIPIPGATAGTYTVGPGYIGQYVIFQVTPRDSQGRKGHPYRSDAVGPVDTVLRATVLDGGSPYLVNNVVTDEIGGLHYASVDVIDETGAAHTIFQ